MINVPRTIPNPGKASTIIFVEGVVSLPSDERHHLKTNIRGDTNLNIKVKIANGQRRWGEVDAK